jgi:hypothetical protein
MSRSPNGFAASSSPGPAAPPAALEEAAWALETVPPCDRRALVRDEAALAVDRLLARVARSRGALDVALCEGLATLAAGDRLLRLGWSGVGDYARERLGVAARTAQAMVRLGRALGERPLLRSAVRGGLVSARAAQVVLPVALGGDEASWVERAGSLTVRALAEAVLARQGSVTGGAGGTTAGLCSEEPVAEALATEDADDGGEAWQRVAFPVTASARAALEEALEVAGRLLGEGSPRWQRLEGIAEEYLGSHPAEDADHEVVAATLATWRGESLEEAPGGGDVAASAPEPGWRAAWEAALEEETGRWGYLEALEPVAAPVLASDAEQAHVDPARLDRALRELAALRERWEGLVGHLALLARMLGLWRDMGFASFGHYCRERLGLGLRSVEQRIALERRLHDLPSLREAHRLRQLSAEQARLVARVATEETAAAWMARAAGHTCLELRRLVEGEEEAAATRWASLEAAQACAPVPAPELLRLRVPVRVAALLAAAFRAAQRGDGRWLDASACLERVARHFLQVWSGLPRARSTPQRRALRRDGGRCLVPGCSRAAAHAHHIRYRSHGGGDEAANLVSLCAAHHLHGVHRGFLRIRGEAPGDLVWELAACG